MKAYIIYYAEEAKKNAGFIRLFQEYGYKKGIEFIYADIEHYKQLELPKLVINRTRRSEVSRFYEEKNIKVLNSSQITEVCNDKYRTMDFLAERLPESVLKGHWCPKTFLIQETGRDELVLNFRKKLLDMNYSQMVIKTVDGHGGSEVYIAGCHEIEKLAPVLVERKCIMQEYIASDARDIRVYVLYGKIYAAILRQGKAGFKSNYSLGGHAQEYDLSEEQRKYIDSFIHTLDGMDYGFIGIDFLVGMDEKLIFNEIEEMVGTRMLYSSTDKNIVKDFVEGIR